MALLFLDGAFPKGLALLVFLAAAATDYVDGYLARKNNQITNFGKLMDPIADKVLVLSAFIAFVQMGLMPAWMALIVISRDLFITGWRLLIPSEGSAQSARKSGKHKTVLQFAFIIGVLLLLFASQMDFWDPAWSPLSLRIVYYSMLFIVTVTIWSGIRYFLANRQYLR